MAYLNKTKCLRLVFVKEGDRKLFVYVDEDYANKNNDRRSVSGAAVVVGGTVVMLVVLRITLLLFILVKQNT